jgi:hypothetical protein
MSPRVVAMAAMSECGKLLFERKLDVNMSEQLNNERSVLCRDSPRSYSGGGGALFGGIQHRRSFIPADIFQ